VEPEEKTKKKYPPDLVRKLAMFLTGHKGNEALNRLAKQLVIGAVKDKGFTDHQNDNLPEVYERPYVVLGHFNVLTRFSIASDAGRFSWDFASGISDGQRLAGFASAKGRSSHWVGDGAEKLWKELNIAGAVLVGLYDGDIRFFYIDKEEFFSLGTDRINPKTDSENLVVWEENWNRLTFQQTFAGIFGS